MSPWLLYVVALVYVWVAFDYVGDGRYGMALAFIAYATANVGFAWDLLEMR